MSEPAPAATQQAGDGASASSWAAEQPASGSPEVLVGAAFVGGLVLARLLRRLGG